MPGERLSHLDKKESTVKWFIISIIPILNLYFLWKLAQSVSGHEKRISGEYEVIEHLDQKESTAKWFIIFLLPTILVSVYTSVMFFSYPQFRLMGMKIPQAGSALAFAFIGFGIMALISIIIGLYALYKIAEPVSGHEKFYKQYETLRHLKKKESTIKWFIIGLVPILNLYFLWQSAEMVSGHEVIHK